MSKPAYLFFIKFSNGDVMVKRGMTRRAAERLYQFHVDNVGGFKNVGFRADDDSLSNRVLLKNAVMI